MAEQPKERLDRINELAKKDRSVGLTPEEKIERQKSSIPRSLIKKAMRSRAKRFKKFNANTVGAKISLFNIEAL